ncbi:hypothetical protein JZ751_000822 [Albula glossodonta]|uniref:non-specific serine/threonine protein kinase n=1 Tax=Albula glossodonta TaxID=121402 RepID=A0A8T2PXH8_9TELE|nr:hypothetical protein JZ751_000822 [Albula glossodonta]
MLHVTTASERPFLRGDVFNHCNGFCRGKFAVVKKCVEKRTGREYAAKFLRKRRKGQDCRLEIIHEIAVLELATASPRVISLHQVYETAKQMGLVIQLTPPTVTSPHALLNRGFFTKVRLRPLSDHTGRGPRVNTVNLFPQCIALASPWELVKMLWFGGKPLCRGDCPGTVQSWERETQLGHRQTA